MVFQVHKAVGQGVGGGRRGALGALGALGAFAVTVGFFFASLPVLVLATVPVLDPAGFIGLHGNGLTPSKIDDFLSEPSL